MYQLEEFNTTNKLINIQINNYIYNYRTLCITNFVIQSQLCIAFLLNYFYKGVK